MRLLAGRVDIYEKDIAKTILDLKSIVDPRPETTSTEKLSNSSTSSSGGLT